LDLPLAIFHRSRPEGIQQVDRLHAFFRLAILTDAAPPCAEVLASRPPCPTYVTGAAGAIGRAA